MLQITSTDVNELISVGNKLFKTYSINKCPKGFTLSRTQDAHEATDFDMRKTMPRDLRPGVTRAKVVALYRKAMIKAHIAKKLKISDSSVDYHLKQAEKYGEI